MVLIGGKGDSFRRAKSEGTSGRIYRLSRHERISPGPPALVARIPVQSWIYGGGGRRADARDRDEHRHILGSERCAPEAGAVSRSRPAGVIPQRISAGIGPRRIACQISALARAD